MPTTRGSDPRRLELDSGLSGDDCCMASWSAWRAVSTSRLSASAAVAQLTALLHQAFRGRAYRLRPVPDYLRNRVTLVQMRADAVGEVLTTAGAEIRVAAKIRAELGQREAAGTGDALDHVVRTMQEQKSAFLVAQHPGPSAIDVGQATGAERDGVSRRDRSRAAGTRPRVSCHQPSLVAKEQ